MYDKPWYKSKAIWGFGLAGIIAIAQIFGVSASSSSVAEITKILTMFLGAYGVRSAVANQ